MPPSGPRTPTCAPHTNRSNAAKDTRRRSSPSPTQSSSPLTTSSETTSPIATSVATTSPHEPTHNASPNALSRSSNALDTPSPSPQPRRRHPQHQRDFDQQAGRRDRAGSVREQ